MAVNKTRFKALSYSPKILLAWGEAISGNTKIKNWLGQNGYPELYTFVHALHLQKDARKWLMANGYPHLLAMIQGVERNKSALKWLQDHKFSILWHIAKAADGDHASLQWLLHAHRDFAHIALKIQTVKDEIQMNHDDPHRMSKM